MRAEPVDPPAMQAALGGYAHGLRVGEITGLLFISGQIPVAADGTVADDFESQCRQVWANLGSVLDEAGLSLDHLVKVTTFLSDRRYADANSRIRREVLGNHRPALTVLITGIYDERWLLEIEAVAAR